MLWILGALAILGILFLILNRFFEGMNIAIWFANFFSWAALVSVLVVGGLNMAVSTRDYAYMEGFLSEASPQAAVANERFLELYLKYKYERRYWINRQFTRQPSEVLVKLFESTYVLDVRVTEGE